MAGFCTNWRVSGCIREEAELGSLQHCLLVHLPSFTEGEEAMTEEIQKAPLVIPEKFESHEEMVSLHG